MGCVMMFTAALGILRFSDIYMRIHASGKAGTGGTISILAGVLIRLGFHGISGKVLLIMIFLLFTGPILSHAIARAAYVSSGPDTEVPFHEVDIKSSPDDMLEDSRGEKDRN
ncbi:MAG: monovalent cation/H(+) antiporter subunit G [Thermoplasmata archaeon]